MEDIAIASGIPRGTLYYYFDGKSEILTFLLGAMLLSFSEKFEQAVHSSDDTRTRLEALMRAQLGLIAANPATAPALMSHIGQISRPSDLAVQIDQLCLAPIRELLDDGVRRNEVGAIDIATAASTIFAAVSISAITSLVLGNLDIDQLSNNLMAVLWNGLSA
jgi:AcrR family transcriptional regulator